MTHRFSGQPRPLRPAAQLLQRARAATVDRPAVRRLLRRPSPLALRVLGVVAAFVALVSWAYASPVGSSPDDDYHLNSIWCAHGIEAGQCEQGTSPDTRVVPYEVQSASYCYRFENAKSAGCQLDDPRAGELVTTDRGNWLNVYPPVYYWFHGLFVTGDLTGSVLLMRVVNALFFLGLIAAVFALVPAGLRPPLIGGALITIVPLGMFLVPSNNPSAWSILSAITLPIALLGYLTASDRRRRWGLGALAAVALLIGAGARGDSATYAIVAIGAAVILSFRFGQGARGLKQLLLPGVLAVVAALLFFSVRHSEALNTTFITEHYSATFEPLTLSRVWRLVAEVPTLWTGALGGWELGWVDTPLPGAVGVLAWSAFAAVVFVAIARVSARIAISVGLIALAVLFVPSYFHVSANVPVGVFVQPRYILPLLAMLAVVAMVRLDGTPFQLTRVQRWTIVSALAIAHTIAMHTNIRRYVTGIDEWSINLNRGIEWWWQIPLSPMVIWLIGSIAFAAAAALLTRDLVERAPTGVPAGAAAAAPAVRPDSDRDAGLAFAART